jgi:hypothetical protein
MSECSFVDRDMFMRYLGGGIGHMAVATQREEENADEEADIHDITARAKVSELNDHLLLEELRQAARHQLNSKKERREAVTSHRLKRSY